MIMAADAIAVARELIGTPYSELDCINLIKKVIRDAPGGVKGYTTAGTNTLWRSIDAAAKYRDLTFRQTDLAGAQAGMLAFKADGEDVHHVGLVTDAGTVIHSSSTQGGRGVVETPLTEREGWTCLARHRLISTKEEKDMEEMACVRTRGGKLNVREEPEGRVIAQLENEERVGVLQEEGEWLKLTFADGRQGYAFAAYIERGHAKSGRMRIVDRAGNVFEVEGGFSVERI